MISVSNKKSILFVQGLFYPSKMGGPSKTLYDMACKCSVDGYDIKVISGYEFIDNPDIVANQWITLSGFKVIYCSPSIPKINLRSFSKAIGQISKVDTIVFSSFFYVINFPLVIYALFKRKNVIWSPRGETMAMKSTFKRAWVRMIKFLCGKKVTFHATTEIERDNMLLYLSESKVIVIPNLLDLPECLTTKKREDNYILFVGRVAPIKAIERVIEAIFISKKFKESNYKFFIAGPIERQFQDYYNLLIELIMKCNLTDKIVFIGNVSGVDKEQIYHDAKSLVLASFSENFGNVVVESLSQGTPVIASLGTPWSSLNEFKAGYHVSNEPSVLAEAFDNLISLSDDEYKSMRESALKLAAEYRTDNMSKWYQYL